MSAEASRYCIQCGVELEPAHRFCWNCGTPRWSPPADAAPAAAPAPPSRPAAPAPSSRPAARTGAPVSLGPLPWIYAGGAVFFLVWATQALALFVSSVGRSQLLAEMGRQGVPRAAQPSVLVAYGVLIVGGAVLAAALHAAAFYGLRRRRRWGWLSAVVVAGLWSLLIIGVPVLLRLIDRRVRQTFGVD